MRISRSLTILGSVFIITLGGVWIAHAAIPSADGTFTACINKTSGAVRIIDTATTSSCKSSEILRTWNQAGQPGQDGEDGTEITVNDIYFAVGDTPGNQDTATRRTRSAFCDVGDTPLDADVRISGLGGASIDTMSEISVLTGGPQHGKFLDLVTTAPIPDSAIVRIDVRCLDAAPAHED